MIFSARGSDDERAGPQSEARSRSPAFIRAATVRDARHRSLRRLSAAASGKRRGSDVAAPDRRTVHALAVAGLPAYDRDAAGRGTGDQPQTCEAADALDGDRRPGAEAADHEAGPRARDVSVSAARCDGRAAEPGLGRRYHLHSDWARLSLPRRRDGLVEPSGAELAPVEHHGRVVLRLGAGGSRGPGRPTGDLRFRTRQPIY